MATQSDPTTSAPRGCFLQLALGQILQQGFAGGFAYWTEWCTLFAPNVRRVESKREVAIVHGLALAELLPAAVGIALNPPAVVAVILMLSSAHPRRNAISFLCGWMTGLFLVGAVVLLVGDLSGALGGQSTTALVVKLLLGVVLLAVAFTQWRKGRSAAGEPEMPGWMRSLAEFSAAKCFVTAALFSGLNPKTLALNVAGVALIVEAQLSVATEWAALAVFVVLSSVTVAAPVAYYLVAPEGSKRALDASKRWLVANNAAITAVVLLVLGVMLVAAGAQGLIAR